MAKEISSNLAEVLSYTDYYPHGGVLPGRNFVSSPAYKLGYQGQEKDAETGFSNFELRQFDARLGRWFNPDPMGQYYSPYLAMGNNPVSMTDPNGGWDGPVDDATFDRMLRQEWEHTGNLYDWNKMNPHDRAEMQQSYGTGNTYNMYAVHDGAGGQSMHMTAEGAANSFNEQFSKVGLSASYSPGEEIFKYSEVRYSDMVREGNHTGDISFKEALQLNSSLIGESTGYQLSPNYGRMYVEDYTFTEGQYTDARKRSSLKYALQNHKASGRIDQSFFFEDAVIGGIVSKGAFSGVKKLLGGVSAAGGESAEILTQQGSSNLWSNSTVFNGEKVLQRNDLINPILSDANGLTNVQRMQRGLAPIGPDGKSLNLHHLIQVEGGGLAEVTATMHQRYYSILHINPNTIPSGINRSSFNSFRDQYWKNRANDFLGN